MADASDSKSDAGDSVRVQVPPSALEKGFVLQSSFFLCKYMLKLYNRSILGFVI